MCSTELGKEDLDAQVRALKFLLIYFSFYPGDLLVDNVRNINLLF